MQTPDWQFPASDGGIFEGLNDAGIETFTKHPIEKEGREAIQNALDPVKDPSQPVRVDIHISTLRSDKIPGARTLAWTYDQCLATNERRAALNGEAKDKKAASFFSLAKSRLATPMNLTLVRISDYNTTGLVGAADGRFGSPWYKLVKARGDSGKQGGAGGSFGIGKMASFVCSHLHTVFYGTRVAGADSYIGVTRLQSYARSWQGDRPVLTAGTGYYAQGPDMLAIPGPCPLRDTPREEDGTDVYIVCARGKRADILAGFRRAVLQNFFITIYEGNLIVRLTEDGGTAVTLDRDTLGRELDALVAQAKTDKEKKEMHDLWEYYDILRHEDAYDPETYLEILLDRDVFGKAYGLESGDCRLLLKKGEGLNNRILVTRRTGMKLFPFKNFPAGLSFTGILRITGDKMNELYRRMEGPSHMDWDPDRCTDTEADYRGAYNGLRAYLTQMVTENCAPPTTEAVNAYGMEEFFLPDETVVEEHGTKSQVPAKPSKQKARVGRHQKMNPTTKRHSDPAPGDTPNVAPAPAKEPKDRASGPRHAHDRDYVQKTIPMYLLPYNPDHYVYRLTFTPQRTKAHAKIELVGSPERKGRSKKGAYNLAIARAESRGRSLDIRGSEIYLDGVEKGVPVAIDFTLALPGRFMMEANYYEAK